MSILSIRCPGCGRTFQTLPGSGVTMCIHCGKEFPLPLKLMKEATGESDQALREAVDTARINEAFLLLETELTNPLYDQNIMEAMGMFSGMVKEDKTRYLAWSGLFGCLLHQCRKTFLKYEKIPGTDYWLKPGTSVYQNFFQVEGFFYQVSLDEFGKMRPVLCDSILQPGRKAHYYLHNAVSYAEGEEQANMQKLMDEYFTNAPQNMAKKGLEYLLAQRAVARDEADKRIQGKE